MSSEEERKPSKKQKKESKKKKEKKRKEPEKKHDSSCEAKMDTPKVAASNDSDDADVVTTTITEDNNNSKEEKGLQRKRRREERKRLLEQLPKVDENGMAFTKLQQRRMRKRLERGLDPIESPAETHQRLQQEAALKREEEAELAGMIVSKSKPEAEEEEDDEKDVDDNNQDQEGQDEEELPDNRPAKRARKQRKKALPEDYVCQACQNRNRTPHWIYDCPDKVTIAGRNQVSKRLRGLHNPSSTKVFCSGLPFEARSRQVQEIFAKCGRVLHCKLVTFPDSRRCKGEAFLTFETEDGANKALKLNGSTVDNSQFVQHRNKKDRSPSSRNKELKLKVTRALNRFASKHQKNNTP